VVVTTPQDLMTKDIRSKEGWRVLLEIDDSRVQLFHVRRCVLCHEICGKTLVSSERESGDQLGVHTE
jgi:hypothetical protein